MILQKVVTLSDLDQSNRVYIEESLAAEWPTIYSYSKKLNDFHFFYIFSLYVITLFGFLISCNHKL